MYELTIETEFAAAHQLRGYQGSCERVHGHNWKVEVSLLAEDVDEIGLAFDFHALKRITREQLDRVEHTFLNEFPEFRHQNPSSELIARWLYRSLSQRINTDRYRICRVRVWESATASASYYE